MSIHGRASAAALRTHLRQTCALAHGLNASSGGDRLLALRRLGPAELAGISLPLRVARLPMRRGARPSAVRPARACSVRRANVHHVARHHDPRELRGGRMSSRLHAALGYGQRTRGSGCVGAGSGGGPPDAAATAGAGTTSASARCAAPVPTNGDGGRWRQHQGTRGTAAAAAGAPTTMGRSPAKREPARQCPPALQPSTPPQRTRSRVVRCGHRAAPRLSAPDPHRSPAAAAVSSSVPAKPQLARRGSTAATAASGEGRTPTPPRQTSPAGSRRVCHAYCASTRRLV